MQPNGHANIYGHASLDSLDDAASTSGSTAHLQVIPSCGSAHQLCAEVSRQRTKAHKGILVVSDFTNDNGALGIERKACKRMQCLIYTALCSHHYAGAPLI